MCALAIFSSYYESDVIAPIADLLLRTHGLTQLQIGDLNAAMSLPNIPLAILNGYLVDRYGAARAWLEPALRAFPPEALVDWCHALGQPTFVGSSGRVFPRAMKASPLLRAWLKRLSASGVRFRQRTRP